MATLSTILFDIILLIYVLGTFFFFGFVVYRSFPIPVSFLSTVELVLRYISSLGLPLTVLLTILVSRSVSQGKTRGILYKPAPDATISKALFYIFTIIVMMSRLGLIFIMLMNYYITANPIICRDLPSNDLQYECVACGVVCIAGSKTMRWQLVVNERFMFFFWSHVALAIVELLLLILSIRVPDSRIRAVSEVPTSSENYSIIGAGEDKKNQ
jgi:hypothetical protein